MKYIKNYNNLILEFNREDVNLITSEEISDSFSISFEIEMECDDMNVNPMVHENELMKEIKSKLFKSLKENKVDYKDKLEFIDSIVGSLDFDDEDKTLDIILNWESYKDKTEKIIIYNLNFIYQDIIDSADDISVSSNINQISYMKNKIRMHLPKFYDKYDDSLDYVLDATLNRGIEVKQKTYITGINDAVIFINDFFQEFDKQEYWKFSNRTGIHINIGIIKDDIEWNIIKGMITLRDTIKMDIPFVYKDMIWRMNTNFTGSILDKISINKNKVDLHDINKTEKYLNRIIERYIRKIGPRHFAFNISKIKNYGYVEFRYVGGEVNKDLVMNKMLYFCYIIYCMTDSNYKRKKYLKDLYKYIFNS